MTTGMGSAPFHHTHLLLPASDQLLEIMAMIASIARRAPERCSVSLAAFFFTAAIADERGRPATAADILKLLKGLGLRKLHSSYGALLPGQTRYDSGAGWLRAEADPYDGRRRLLRLTDEGRDVLAEAKSALAKPGSKIVVRRETILDDGGLEWSAAT